MQEHIVSYAIFSASVDKNTAITLTNVAKKRILLGSDSKGLYVQVLSSPIIQKARIIKSDMLVKGGVIHYVDYPLTTNRGKMELLSSLWINSNNYRSSYLPY